MDKPTPYEEGQSAYVENQRCMSYPPNYPEDKKDDWIKGWLEQAYGKRSK